VELSVGPSLRAEYLAGCDRARSVMPKPVGINFPREIGLGEALVSGLVNAGVYV
jgi:hypothetical protein